MSTPSIALIPSGYKEGKLYSQLPINGDGDLDFARTGTSGVPNATRVNEQGLIEDVNADVPRLDYSDGGCPVLLLEPQSTNLWVGSEGTDANYTSPLGEFGFTNINGFEYRSDQNVVGKTVSMFFLIKKADNSTPIIGASGTSNADVVVRLAGSSGVSTSFITTDLGNGFYLAEIENYAVIGTSATNVRISNNSGDDTFISMVQLEELSYSTSYIPTLNGTIETRTADVATLDTTGLNLTTITETFSDDSTNVITSVPTTYTVSQGRIKEIIGE